MISVFFESFYKQADSFAAVQAVESAWREVGAEPEVEFQLESIPLVSRLEEKATAAEKACSGAVRSALEAARLVASYHRDSDSRVAEVVASAFTVALEFDRHQIEPPNESSSWFSFEGRGQIDLADRVLFGGARLDPPMQYELRFKAGEDSMAYRRALKKWIAADR
ncbi:hypothetical protein ACFWVC_24580 [Streptomyces sp. NPDC058691]|uniref:hypothetical protein n=1 Tax=Streptomyces sp. NPDC058691 TaxID=3346601 RepID=UPI00366687FC